MPEKRANLVFKPSKKKFLFSRVLYGMVCIMYMVCMAAKPKVQFQSLNLVIKRATTHI